MMVGVEDCMEKGVVDGNMYGDKNGGQECSVHIGDESCEDLGKNGGHEGSGDDEVILVILRKN